MYGHAMDGVPPDDDGMQPDGWVPPDDNKVATTVTATSTAVVALYSFLG